MVRKRGKIDIYYDILVLLLEGLKGDEPKISLTRVAHMANLPYDRFRNYLDELVKLGMVSNRDHDFVVTEKGLEFIKEYKKIGDFLMRMGLRF